MQIELISSSVDGRASRQYLSSYRINRSVLVDAGAAGLDGSPEDQSDVRFVLISHAHADHIASLPILLENVYEPGGRGLTVFGSRSSLDTLRRHVFNDEVWPDLVRLSSAESRFLDLVEMESGATVELDGLRITAVAVDHVVPTFGFIVTEGDVSVLIVSDTGPTQAIWDAANATPNVKGVFLEASFPDSMSGLAAASKHLTPTTFAGEVRKLKSRPRIIAIHIKERHRRRIVEELEALGLPNLEIGVPGGVYDFS
jgi:ribonuclease BN (tRNA processing enzyme)